MGPWGALANGSTWERLGIREALGLESRDVVKWTLNVFNINASLEIQPLQIGMLRDPLSKPADVQMEVQRAGTATDHSRRNKPNSGNSEQAMKCPRCDSPNTKFCYYNNYSLTQPRHFCKNCRRYWTQGGSLRNVPIGGGCRKNKRVKQRALDPHLFGGQLDDHSSFLQHAAAAGCGAAPGNFLSSSSCFMGGPPLPGFLDLAGPAPTDSHMLFSRIQDSLRQNTDQQSIGALDSVISAKQLSLMQQHPTTSLNMYDDVAGLDVSHAGNYVRPEQGQQMHQVFNGSVELGNSFFEQIIPASSGPVHNFSSPGNGVSLDQHQLCSNVFGVQQDAAGVFSGNAHEGHMADAQLKLVQAQQQRQALALHLGAASVEHHGMHNSGPGPSCSNAGTSGPLADVDSSCGLRSSASHQHISPPADQRRYIHHRHLALPDFEDQESPESMGSMNMVMRRGDMHAAVGHNLVKGSSGMNPNVVAGSYSTRTSAAHEESAWQQISSSHSSVDHQLPFALSGGAHNVPQAHSISTSSSHAGPHEQAHNIGFWSPSPANWSTTNQDVRAAGALL
ncbi:hypothetical protein GOP47_0011719 [Adiantum capillus-veneris]|uniref:Dof-type domain-containing protein n=1 Tax=Adiantum capillus-veneris TaxID=13818 RepID=A0A9D4ZI37_ADICA|nr:hypothetical protein GOP47_0011719 [Adiantum capillus-veneris]